MARFLKIVAHRVILLILINNNNQKDRRVINVKWWDHIMQILDNAQNHAFIEGTVSVVLLDARPIIDY